MCSGESTRLPPVWPGFDSRNRRHMWLEFVVGSRSCSEGSSASPSDSLLHKDQHFLNFNSLKNSEDHGVVGRNFMCNPRETKQY